MTKREMAKEQMKKVWADLVATGEWTAEEMAENLADQIEGYVDMACEEMTEEMAELMGWDIEEGMTEEQEAEWEEIVNEAAEEYLAR